MRKADDVIWWVPLRIVGALVNAERLGMARLHRCPAAVVAHTSTRDVLDPMALNECRYCGGELP